MNKSTLEELIASDNHGLLDIDTKANYRIYGRINGQRGGAFYGFCIDSNKPVFGGGNLIHAPVYWNRTWKEVDQICDKIKNKYPNCEATPEKCS